ncbi:hypothetical protein BSQ98_10195 [Serratia liquefaciens]|nr:hypothetical protein BSQ98_10195 [Serratia liquefaciens]
MLGGADKSNGDLGSYITGADTTAASLVVTTPTAHTTIQRLTSRLAELVLQAEGGIGDTYQAWAASPRHRHHSLKARYSVTAGACMPLCGI